MRTVPNAVVSGVVLSVSEKKDAERDGKTVPLDKPYRLVTVGQIGRKGDAKNIELKSFQNEALPAVGKEITAICELSSWAMKGRRDGELLSGISATIIKVMVAPKGA